MFATDILFSYIGMGSKVLQKLEEKATIMLHYMHYGRHLHMTIHIYIYKYNKAWPGVAH